MWSSERASGRAYATVGASEMSPPTGRLTLKPQEIPTDHPHSVCMFRKPLVATAAAVNEFGEFQILVLSLGLQARARTHGGLDYLQVYRNDSEGPDLWFIEDGEVVTALLPSDY